MVTLVDNFGGTFLIFVLGIFELFGIFYFYGLEELCLDLEFVTGHSVTFYWRFCWVFLSPLTMSIVFVYSTVTMEPLKYANLDYPHEYIVAGWAIFLVGMFQLPLWMFWKFGYEVRDKKLYDSLCQTFKPTENWGPANPQIRNEWRKFKEEAKRRRRIAAESANHGFIKRKLYTLFGKY